MDRNALRYLLDLNQHCDEAMAALKKLAEYPELQEEDFTVFESYLREHLAHANVMVFEELEKLEHATSAEHFRIRLAFENTIRDPNDCYFDVIHREEERRQAGLPPLVGILHGMRRMTPEDALKESLVEEAAEASTDDDQDEKGH